MVINPKIRHAFDRFFHRTGEKFKISEHTILIVLALFVGVITGLGAVGFRWLIVTAGNFFFGHGAQGGQVLGGDSSISHYMVPLIPMIGGLLVGPIVAFFAPEAKGHGVPEVMEAVALKGGVIRPRVALAKSVASALCIGSGGSAGREGPIVQIGAATASTIGILFRMSADRVKILVGCGSAAGIAAVFNAPIAGVMFALEVILGDFAIQTFSPVILSSVVSVVISHYFVGDYPAFIVPKYNLVSAWEIPMYMVLGIACGAVAVLFIITLYKFEDIFDYKIKINPALKPAIGGIILGSIGFFFPQVFADGYKAIDAVFGGKIVWELMFLLIFLKIIATSLTLGSGNSGGIFAPSLFMGAMTGGVFGTVVHTLFPQITATPGAYILVGMGAAFAGSTHATITGIIILFEMTNDYRIILPLMVATVFSTLVANRLKKESIYTLKLVRRGIRLKGGKDIALLDTIKVSEVMTKDYNSVPPDMTLRHLLHLMEEGKGDCYPVVDRYGDLRGMVAMQDIRTLITKEGMQDLVIVSDIIGPSVITITPDETLNDALRLFGMRDVSILPVVDPKTPRRLIGLLYRKDVLSVYNRKLLQKETSD